MSKQHGPSFTMTTPSDTAICFHRTIAAEPALVYDAWTNPELVPQWWGCGDMTIPECEIDRRVGGEFRMQLLHGDGRKEVVRGRYLELDPPNQLVHTMHVEGLEFTEMTITVTLDACDGGTKVTERLMFQSPSDRDTHLQHGIEEAAAVSYDRLAALLEGAHTK